MFIYIGLKTLLNQTSQAFILFYIFRSLDLHEVVELCVWAIKRYGKNLTESLQKQRFVDVGCD